MATRTDPTTGASLDALTTALLPRCTFPDGGVPVVCAYSGGPDSTALLVLAAAAGCDVRAIHVDHRLRPESAAEAEHAAANATLLGISCEVVVAPVADGPNLEARARTARRAALPAGHLTGHTADDQAETLLINLLRGAGIDGLAAMQPGPTHPLLALRRHETVELCAAAGLTVVSDASNHDSRHLRNRIRHELLPLLDDVSGRDVAAVLARNADVIRDDAALLEALLDDRLAEVELADARQLQRLGEPLGRRALRRWLTTVLPYPPDRATLGRAWDVVGGTAGSCELGGGLRLLRSAQQLRIVDERAATVAAPPIDR